MSHANANLHCLAGSSCGIGSIGFADNPTTLPGRDGASFLLLVNALALPPLLVLGLSSRPRAAGPPAQGPSGTHDRATLRRRPALEHRSGQDGAQVKERGLSKGAQFGLTKSKLRYCRSAPFPIVLLTRKLLIKPVCTALLSGVRRLARPPSPSRRGAQRGPVARSSSRTAIPNHLPSQDREACEVRIALCLRRGQCKAVVGPYLKLSRHSIFQLTSLSLKLR